MTLYKWSQTASADATADSTVNWAEGQSPSSVNDSARAMMAAIAKYRDDGAGAIVTSGTSTAYAVSTYQVFQSLSQLNGQVIAFTPHLTNGATVSINVDGLGAKPLRSAPSVELPAGVLVQGTPYAALYNASDAAFYIHGFFNSPYSIPIGASVDFWGSTAPNSSFVLAYGQAISRTTYSTLFAMFSTTYGSGDGSTTFNVPDLRGRIVAGKDDMGGSAASRLSASVITTGGATTLGGSGGAETKTLVTGNLPPYTPSGSISASITSILLGMKSASTSGSNDFATAAAGTTVGTGLGQYSLSLPGGNVSASFIGVAQGGTSTPLAIVQPTIIANKLLRII
ncbi:phage tail protein [Bradyrhizobium ottawaense]|uniref:phage tail protein n=1 Tax=Bradyrhizobium ottawaense TaxID=931866 RepID=UPI0030F41001